MKKILVIGSLNMDYAAALPRLPQVGETTLAAQVSLNPGGKGANQAYAAARLGAQVQMLGAVGCDSNGSALLQNLRQAGVGVAAVRQVPDSYTAMALIEVFPDGGNRILVLPGANLAMDESWLDLQQRLVQDCDILLLQLEIPLSTVCRAARLAHGLGKTVILDPAPARQDIPPDLWPDIDILKPNELELHQLAGDLPQHLTLEQAAESMLELGCRWVLVTRGSQGSVCLGQNGSSFLVPPLTNVKAVDSTGAGDCYSGALAAGLARNLPLDRAMRLAAAAAELSVMKAGAQSAMPDLERVLAYLPELASTLRPAD
ncbi:ribokinase [Oscillospiraceae bacterium HV4-5-C5C]|nr:ribokinase [Oscillospiraceae bacterium HV4-5-C5C]